MPVKSFRDFLQEKARAADHDERRNRREEWVGAVERLVSEIRAWLKEADPEGILEVVEVRRQKLEQGLGAYEVPSLEIHLGDSLVRVTPVGRNVVGFIGPLGDVGVRAEGRIDITDADGIRKYILYRVLKDGEHWYVLDERYEISAFDRSRLEEIIQELMS
jgi:hypothetical protein